MGKLSLRNVFVRGTTSSSRTFSDPVADFTTDVVTGTVPLTVNFTDSTTNFPTSWAWDFNNDGTVDSTVQNPSYTYNTPGTYAVKLVASNVSGSSEIVKTALITVDGIPTYTLSRSGVSVNEGSSVTITLNTEYVQPGTVVPYTISGTGITTADIGGASLTGNFTVQGTLQSGSATLTLSISADALTEGAETLTLSITTPSRTISVVINDTSLSVIQPGESLYTTPGTYTFTVPTGVTTISAVLVGGGAGAWRAFTGNKAGGGGSGLRYINNVSVTPGQAVTVIVGAGGTRGNVNPPTSGQNSSLTINSNVIVFAGGGQANQNLTSPLSEVDAPGGTGSTIGGNIGGGNGGAGGKSPPYASGGGGGGGTGGYSGNGGYGGSIALRTNGSGGGGAGGQSNFSSGEAGVGGGGVGLYGVGASGAGVGAGGSGGSNATNTASVANGGVYGGGAAAGQALRTASSNSGNGGSGAVRIIWGTGRSFPSNAA